MDREQKARQIAKVFQLAVSKMDLTEDEAAEVSDMFEPWEVGKNYLAGKRLKHGENKDGAARLYEVKKDHTSAQDAPPDKAANLYKELKKGV